MNLIENLKQIPKSSRPTLIVVFVAVALIAFITGLVPMWIKAHGEKETVASLEREAVLMKLENNLASATIDARGGRYEPARKKASEFFTDLRLQLDQGRDSAISQNDQQRASALLNDRDHLITLLARGDPAAADRLANLYLACQQITGPGHGLSANESVGASAGDRNPVGGSP